MVGVPRSRGCAACKQQKKKCSGGLQPPCVRCKRLNIPCIGLGARFLKFQDEGAKFANPKKTTSSKQAASSVVVTTSRKVTTQRDLWEFLLLTIPKCSNVAVPAGLGNSLTSLTSGLAYTLSDPSADTNYGLIWSFGPFLSNIPQHLGLNESLDAAIDGLIVTYSDFRITQRFSTSPLSLQKYSTALTSLRKCLMTTETACQPETLAAIMVIMVLETLLGVRDTRGLMHCDGAARIFKCRGTRPPANDLEKLILLTLRGPVVCQAFFVEESYFTDEEWTSMINGFLAADSFSDPTFFPLFAATTRLFQRCRMVLTQDSPSAEDLGPLRKEASALRKKAGEAVSMQFLLVENVKDLRLSNQSTPSDKYQHSYYTREYGMLLITQMQINCILAAISDGDGKSKIEAENVRLCDETCAFAETEGLYHRPLGTLYMRLMLYFAYAAAATPVSGSNATRARVVNLLLEHIDHSTLEVSATCISDLKTIGEYLSLRDTRTSSLRFPVRLAVRKEASEVELNTVLNMQEESDSEELWT